MFLDAAGEANAVPCLMPMQSRGAACQPVLPGWGLKHALTGALVDPVVLVSDELIEMTDWEVHDLAIQVVRDQLRGEGKKPWSWQSSLHIDPSLWFDDEEAPAWVVVRAVRYPESKAAAPTYVEAIRAQCVRISRRGFFASVAVASADDPFDESKGRMPLWRGHAMNVRFEGLQALEPGEQ